MGQPRCSNRSSQSCFRREWRKTWS